MQKLLELWPSLDSCLFGKDSWLNWKSWRARNPAQTQHRASYRFLWAWSFSELRYKESCAMCCGNLSGSRAEKIEIYLVVWSWRNSYYQCLQYSLFSSLLSGNLKTKIDTTIILSSMFMKSNTLWFSGTLVCVCVDGFLIVRYEHRELVFTHSYC